MQGGTYEKKDSHVYIMICKWEIFAEHQVFFHLVLYMFK